MTSPVPPRPGRLERARQISHSAIRIGSILGLLALLTLGVWAESDTQRAAPSGEELYVDLLGCWNCHGNIDDVVNSKKITKPALPLLRWLAYVRRPSGEVPALIQEVPNTQMPPFSLAVVSDADLVFLYRWLDGVDVFRTPLPVGVALKVSPHTSGNSDTQIVVTSASETRVTPDVSPSGSLEYRVLVQSDEGPVANQVLDFQPAGGTKRAALTTDQHGESVLPQGTGQLRLPLPPGRYAVIVEARDVTDPTRPTVAGIGSAVLTTE